MYSSYTPLPRLISPCLAFARYVFKRPVERALLLVLLLLAGCQDGAEQQELQLGQRVWQGTCKVCHLNGLGGAPAKGNRKAWAARIDQGLEVLVEHALHGFSGEQGSMPARGGNPTLGDAEVRAAVKYMVSQSR